jgi:hypothetical protein
MHAHAQVPDAFKLSLQNVMFYFSLLQDGSHTYPNCQRQVLPSGPFIYDTSLLSTNKISDC